MTATRARMRLRTVVLAGLALSVVLAGFISLYASGHPDGLEHVSTTLGFGSTARDSATAGSPLAGYEVAGIGDSRLAGGAAGLVGVAAVGALMAGLVWLLRRRPSDETP